MRIIEVFDALKTRRTVRKFKQETVGRENIIKIIDYARLSPSAGNMQSLKYRIIDTEKERKEIYPLIKYAGYIPDWNPEFSETPPAFIAVLNDTTIRKTDSLTECDSGIAMMAISLSAVALGFDSCILGAVDKIEIPKILKFNPQYDLLYLVGIGKSNHKNSYYNSDDSVKYTMDKSCDFKVPKRKLESVIVK